MGTEVLLEVSGQGSQELQGGLEGEAGVGPQVSSQTLHYLRLTKHNLEGRQSVILEQPPINSHTVPESVT